MKSMTMSKYQNPNWWTDVNDTAWDRVKAAMKRDWDQTKHDFGGDEPDTNQSVGHTVKQAAGKEAIPPRREPAYEEFEPAHRFGFGARSKYGDLHEDWDDELEATLRADWEGMAPANKQSWPRHRDAIRYGWDYGAKDLEAQTPRKR